MNLVEVIGEKKIFYNYKRHNLYNAWLGRG